MPSQRGHTVSRKLRGSQDVNPTKQNDMNVQRHSQVLRLKLHIMRDGFETLARKDTCAEGKVANCA